MKHLLLTISLVILCNVASAEVVEAPPAEYRIGIKPAGPFSYKEGDEWKGLSVNLIQRLAAEMNFTYEFVEVNTITALLGLAEFNSTDLAIGAISMTEDREKDLDFSHPYFTTTPGLLVRENNNLFHFVGVRLTSAFALFVLALYVIGWVVSRLDPDDEINNIHKGAWFVLTTFTTTGYGDYVPRNAKAKVFAALLMIVSMFALSAFTGYIASAITVKRLTDDVTTLSDLKNAKIVAVGGSTASDLLDLLGFQYKTVTTPEIGVQQVADGKVKAFLYDKAILDYHALKSDNTLCVYPINRGKERYAIAFPTGSELREPFNRAILGIIDSPEWKHLTAQYFGNQ